MPTVTGLWSLHRGIITAEGKVDGHEQREREGDAWRGRIMHLCGITMMSSGTFARKERGEKEFLSG